MRRGIKNVPLGVKIISILYYIGAAIFVFAGLLLIVFGVLFLINSSLIISTESLPEFISSASNVSFAILLMGIIICLVAILEFFIARGLFKGKLWTKVLVVVFSIVGVITGLLSVFSRNFSGIINILFSGLVGGYLLFGTSSKLFFSS